MARCLDRLDRGKIEALVASAELARIVANEAEYFARNAKRMRYPAFREQGLFVGSGVVEAGCKTVIGAAGASSSSSSSSSSSARAARLKRSGSFWTVDGANSIIALRCCRFS